MKLIDAFLNGFVKAAAEQAAVSPSTDSFHAPNIPFMPKLPSFSLGMHPDHASVDYNYDGAHSSVNFTPNQLSSYADNLNLNPQIRNGLSAWSKYNSYVDAPFYKKMIGLTPRPILNNDEIRATQPMLNNTTLLDVGKKLWTDPEARTEVGRAALQPSAIGTTLGLGSYGSKLTRMPGLAKVLGTAAAPLDAVTLISGLANEAKTVPDQVVDAGGFKNYLNDQSNVNADYQTAPGYLRHVMDNIGKPASSIVGVTHDFNDISKMVPGMIGDKYPSTRPFINRYIQPWVNKIHSW